MKQLFLLFLTIFIFTACGTKYKNINLNTKQSYTQNMKKLANDILKLSNNINKEEAHIFSHDAIRYSKVLASRYEVTTPALFHNALINMNLKTRGYCYHYANDLHEYFRKKRFNTFYFIRAVALRGKYFEHSSLVLTRDDLSFEDSLVLDAWRDTGDLFWSKVKDDKKYDWEIK
jgi:hypothetical protein